MAGLRSDTKERLQRFHGALDLLFAKLKAVKLQDNLIELGVCDLNGRQVIFAINL
jgi:hypothetical protein